jgi:flagellar protein FlaG
MQVDGISSSVANISISPRIGQTSTNNVSNGEMKLQRQEKQIEGQKHIEEKKFSEEDVIGIIEKANKNFIAYDRRFEFSIHEVTKQIMVKVIDANTDEVIRELPPEKVLDMVAALWEVAGILVDRKI